MLLTDYMDRARINSGLVSDNRLAAALEISQATISSYRRGFSVPTPAKMVKLAKLAGVSPEVALLHRAAWQADDQVSRAVMSRLIASWMEAPGDNALTGARSLGAAATPAAKKSARLGYIMEKLAHGMACLCNALAPEASQGPGPNLSFA
jgi:transcriptional regulator with XRE-family HTH domain